MVAKLKEQGEAPTLRMADGHEEIIIVRGMRHSQKQAEWLLYHLEKSNTAVLGTHIEMCKAIADNNSAEPVLKQQAKAFKDEAERLVVSEYSPDTPEKTAKFCERIAPFLEEMNSKGYF